MLFIEELPSITFREISRLMRIMWPWPDKPVATETTIASVLSGMLVSVKLVHDVQQKPAGYNLATEAVSQYCFNELFES